MSEPESIESISLDIVEEILRDWVNAAHRLTTVDLDSKKSQYHEGQIYAASLMRGLYLGEPHLVAAQIRDALKLAGWEPPIGAIEITYGGGGRK